MVLPNQSPFVWGKNGQQLSPDQVDQLRVVSALAARSGADTSPVGHWSQGLARLVDGWGGYKGNMRANDQEAAGMASADAAINGNPILSSTLGGDQAGMATPSPMVSALAQQGQASAPQISPDGSIIRQGLVERGLPEHVADAFVMNFQDESGLNPGINEQNPLVAGSRGGFGLAQWTGPRRRELEAFAAQRGAPVSDADVQMDFLMQELQGSERGAAQSILSAQDAPTAAAAIVNKFLRPAEEHRARREAQYLGGAAPSYASQPAGAPNNVVAALAQAQGNPWVQKKYGGVIEALMGQQMRRDDAGFEQQMRQSDPMYQAQLQGQMLQNQSALQPAAPKPIEVGGVLLDPTTYQPIFDSRAAPEQFRTITGPDAAQMGLDPAQAYNVGGDGKITQIGGGGTNVTVNNPGSDKFDEAFGSADAATIETVSNAGLQAQRNLGRIDRLESLLSQGPTGMQAGVKAALGEYGLQTKGLDTLQAAQALINSMVPEQRQPGSGPMSDADLALFKQSLPRLINNPDGNAMIVHTLRGIAQYDAEGAQISQQLRAGEIDRATAFQMLQERPNPLAGFGEGASRFSQPDSAQGLSGTGWQEINGVRIRRKGE